MSTRSTHDVGTQRAVVLQLLRDDHPARWSRVELERELPGDDRTALERALRHLADVEVVVLDGDRVRASAPARYLETLGLICV